MLPVPNATTVLSKNSDVRIALDLTEEWNKAAALNGDSSALYQGCVIVRREFLEQYPAAVEQFMEDYKKSVDFVNSNPADAAEMIAACEIIPAAAIAQKAIPDANIVLISGKEMAEGLSGFYKVLYDFNPASVGGKIPDESIYYQK